MHKYHASRYRANKKRKSADASSEKKKKKKKKSKSDAGDALSPTSSEKKKVYTAASYLPSMMSRLVPASIPLHSRYLLIIIEVFLRFIKNRMMGKTRKFNVAFLKAISVAAASLQRDIISLSNGRLH